MTNIIAKFREIGKYLTDQETLHKLLDSKDGLKKRFEEHAHTIDNEFSNRLTTLNFLNGELDGKYKNGMYEWMDLFSNEMRPLEDRHKFLIK